MPTRCSPRSLFVLAAAFCAALPSSALADHKPSPFKAVATISACAGDALTVAAEIKPRAGAEIPREVRGANLRMRFEATPLHGEPQVSDEFDLGRTTSGRRFEPFSGLAAQTYTGIVRYRWVRGGRTVYKAFVRSTKARAAGRRGAAYCSLPVGKQPQDTTPPFVLPVPYDNAWRKGPLNVFIYAADDLSGVAAVWWRLDGGALNKGRRVQITGEGSHTLQYLAFDAAGNRSKPAAVTLRVDTSAPTAATITGPTGATSDPTPLITWNAATDSGSGVRAYFVAVKNGNGEIVFGEFVAANTTSVTVPDNKGLPAGQYTLEVHALDGTTPTPQSSTAKSSFSVG